MTTYYLDYANGNNTNNGSSWAQAWKNMEGVGTTPVAGDVVKIAKTPAPISIGNAQWTNKSNTVEISAGRTLDIDNCSIGWSSSVGGDVALYYSTSNGLRLTFDSAPQTNRLQAYKAISPLDLSQYDQIAFQFSTSATLTLSNCFKICLCSDTVGQTIVDTFTLPNLNGVINYTISFNLPRDGGGYLGNNIQSIAFYTGSNITGLASKYIYIKNAIACKTNDINYSYLISKNSQEQGGEEAWYSIDSISGTTVKLACYSMGASYGKYYGDTELVETYIRQTVNPGLISKNTSVSTVQVSGNSAGYIEFQGGYDTITNVQDGETFLQSYYRSFTNGLSVNAKNYIKVNRLNTSNFQYGLYFYDTNNCYLENVQTFCGNTTAIELSGGTNFYSNFIANIVGSDYGFRNSMKCDGMTINTINNILGTNTHGVRLSEGAVINLIKRIVGVTGSSAYGVYASGINCTIDEISLIDSINGNGILLDSYSRVHKLGMISNTLIGIIGGSAEVYVGYVYLTNNSTASISPTREHIINECVTDDLVPVTISNVYCSCNIKSLNGIPTHYDYYGNYSQQPSIYGGLEWKVNITRTISFRQKTFDISIAKVAVVANSLVTVSCNFKKSSATDIQGKLILKRSNLDYSLSDLEIAVPNDTNLNTLTLSFVPPVSGVFEIAANIWSELSVTDYVTINDLEITQA